MKHRTKPVTARKTRFAGQYRGSSPPFLLNFLGRRGPKTFTSEGPGGIRVDFRGWRGLPTSKIFYSNWQAKPALARVYVRVVFSESGRD